MNRIKALVENVNGKMLAIASDDSVDRQGDSIKQKWNLLNFKKNPVLLLSHQYHLPPVGIAKNIRIEGNKLMFEPVFHNITSAAKEVGQMYAEGIMRAFSVGFMGNKDANELLEISAVSVPANANALMLSKSFTEEDKNEIDNWMKKAVGDEELPSSDDGSTPNSDEPNIEQKIDEILSAINDIYGRLDDIEKGRQEEVKTDKAVLIKSLENLNKSLGYLNRKIGK